MHTFVFTKKAEKEFTKLSGEIRERILAKLKELKTHEAIFSVLKPLHHFEPATHRLRVGSYRLILALKSQEKEAYLFWILDVGDRKEIYRV